MVCQAGRWKAHTPPERALGSFYHCSARERMCAGGWDASRSWVFHGTVVGIVLGIIRHDVLQSARVCVPLHLGGWCHSHWARQQLGRGRGRAMSLCYELQSKLRKRVAQRRALCPSCPWSVVHASQRWFVVATVSWRTMFAVLMAVIARGFCLSSNVCETVR